MVTHVGMSGEAYYSVVKYARRPETGEFRNLAVVLVTADGEWGDIRAVPISSVSSRLTDQGLVDRFVADLRDTVRESHRLRSWDQLTRLSGSLTHSFQVSAPLPAFVPATPEQTLDALFGALVGGRRPVVGHTKAMLLDRVLTWVRGSGVRVTRGAYVREFLFDALIESPEQGDVPIHVASFRARRTDWSLCEKEAAHYAFALSKLDVEGIGVVNPPDPDNSRAAEPYSRIMGWLGDAGVSLYTPDQFKQRAAAMDLRLQLHTA